MARRVFPELCMRARKAGAKRLTFTAELDAALADEDNGVGSDGSWSCEADGDSARGPVRHFINVRCYGRTGEEALRLVVDALEAAR